MRTGIYFSDIAAIFKRRPQAVATVHGGEDYPDIYGKVGFYQLRNGVAVCARITNLPKDGMMGFHVHSGGKCTGEEFADAKGHFDMGEHLHPYHSGDMPALLSCDGFAFSAFFTNRFTVQDIIGKTVIVHLMPDDYCTQPAGNSGERIACGRIKKVSTN